MKVLLIEDETAAARNLKAILKEINPEIEVIETLESITETIQWVKTHPQPDLLFVDIHLADGESFQIFREVDITSPVIFTTAYDQYALEAFKVNSIDYLLKPINRHDVERALQKWQCLTGREQHEYQQRVQEMTQKQTDLDSSTKSTFLIHVRDKLIPLSSSQIAYCYTSSEKVSATDFEGKTYPMDKPLEYLQGIFSEENFFRANRQFIISREAIKEIAVWFGSRLLLHLKVETPEKIIISKARVPEFKKWLTRK